MSDEYIQATDFDRIKSLIRDAFHDDPVCEYYIRQDAKHDEAQKLFWDTIVDIYAVHGKYYTWTDPDYQSTIIWSEDAANSEASLLYQLTCMPTMAYAVGGLFHGLYVLYHYYLVTQMKVNTPLIYVFAIGVDSNTRGQGLGSKIMSKLTALADEKNLPMYLENSKEKNLKFYMKHGFICLRKIYVMPGCPPMWLMFRPAKSPATL